MQNRGNILLVDDNKEFLEATAPLLRFHRYHCESVEDGLTATAKLREAEYDLLISDIDILTSCAALIQEAPQMTSGLPVILVTNHATLEPTTPCFLFSIIAYLRKPIDPAMLVEAADRAIERARICRSLQGNRDLLRDCLSRPRPRRTIPVEFKT